MGATQRDVRFNFTTSDYCNWTPEHLAEFEAQVDTGFSDYSDWVHDQITDAMEQAGHAFMEANPDLFQGDLY